MAARWWGTAGYVLLGLAVMYVSAIAVDRLGAAQFVIVLVLVVLGFLYSAVSFRYLPLPYFIWLLSIGGFRYLWSIQAPLLPDLFLDRMAMVWLMLVYLIKVVVDRQPARRPLRIDLFVLMHGLYILVQIILHDMMYFHDWTMSVLVPYSAFFLTKNIITSRDRVRSLMWVLLALSVYYNVTSVAEKYGLNWLIWPKSILEYQGEFRTRSHGPFLHAPLYGTVIGMMLPIHLYFIATVRRNAAKVLLGISLMVGLGGLYFTYTRGSWITGLVALAGTVALNRKQYLRYVVPALVVAPAIAVGLLGFAQDKMMKERVENEDTIGSRIGTAVTVMRVWRDHPLFGIGYYQYRHVRDKYIAPVEVPGLPTIRFVQFRENPIHDIYLGPLAENGLVGQGLQAVIYILILKSFLAKYARRRLGDEFAIYMLPVAGGVMIGYMIGGLAFDYRFFSMVGTLFMVFAGVVDAYRPGDPSQVRIAA